MYLACVSLDLPKRVVADAFGRDRTAVVRALARVEEGRDDGRFDAAMVRLEHLLAVNARPHRNALP
jgi:hypothetical protein